MMGWRVACWLGWLADNDKHLGGGSGGFACLVDRQRQHLGGWQWGVLLAWLTDDDIRREGG